MKTVCTFFILLLLFPFHTTATTIKPFSNLGKMAIATEVVVLAQVERNYTTTVNGTTHFRNLLRVVTPIKGDMAVGETFVIQNYHTKIGNLERTVWGDLELLENGTYLLFLNEFRPGIWQAGMLSYGSLELRERGGDEVLVPFDLGDEIHFYTEEGQTPPEPLGVYFKDKLVSRLQAIVQGEAIWDKNAVLTDYAPRQFSEGRGTAPSHCTFISTADYARWEDMENTALPVYYNAGGASDCATAATKLGDAINLINTNYQGVDLTNAGTHAFVPTCSGSEGATDTEFVNWVGSNLAGGSRNMLVQFDDPCSEITDLTGCSGTLAIGGLYWFSSTYTANSMTWRSAAYGYVIYNNGVGACSCSSTDYETVMVHELSHSLNIGHIDDTDGVANMNPGCCNDIQSLDIECFDFIYPASVLPVELNSFTGQKEKEVVQLKWVSETEVDNDYYELERLNREGKFEPIYRTTGMGTSYTPQSYGFTDNAPLLGTNIYRLKQTDFDGSSQELGTVSIAFYGKGGLTVELSPNPVTDQEVNMYVYSPGNASAQMTISSLAGQRLIDQQIQLNSGINEPVVNFSQLPAGVYFLQITQRNEKQIVRFVKD